MQVQGAITMGVEPGKICELFIPDCENFVTQNLQTIQWFPSGSNALRLYRTVFPIVDYCYNQMESTDLLGLGTMVIERTVAAADPFITPLTHVTESVAEASEGSVQLALNSMTGAVFDDTKKFLSSLAASRLCPGFEFPSEKTDLNIVNGECPTYHICRKLFRQEENSHRNAICSFTDEFSWDLTIPAGAAKERVAIKAQQEILGSPWDEAASDLAFATLKAEPAGHTMAQPVAISIGVSRRGRRRSSVDCQTLTVLQKDGEQTKIALVPCSCRLTLLFIVS